MSRKLSVKDLKPLLKATRIGRNESIPAVELGQLLTAIEALGAQSLAHDELLKPRGNAFRIGVTGPPGAGKSSLIGQVLKLFREKGLRIGVLAVDPSSPFSKGAILGDRIRYSDHFDDSEIFIRSLGTRGSLGGLSASSYLMLRAYDHVGFDVVLIETVGVGQTELEIMNVADHISVVLVPESGDSVQAMKAGLIEIADSYVVNKADRPGADSLINELKISASEISENTPEKKIPPVLSTIATEGVGVKELVDLWLGEKAKGESLKSRDSTKRLRAEAYSLSRLTIESRAMKQIEKINTLEDLRIVLGAKQ